MRISFLRFCACDGAALGPIGDRVRRTDAFPADELRVGRTSFRRWGDACDRAIGKAIGALAFGTLTFARHQSGSNETDLRRRGDTGNDAPTPHGLASHRTEADVAKKLRRPDTRLRCRGYARRPSDIVAIEPQARRADASAGDRRHESIRTYLYRFGALCLNTSCRQRQDTAPQKRAQSATADDSRPQPSSWSRQSVLDTRP